MLRLRPYKCEDADIIISWSKDERAFYQWSAGVMGGYPLTKEMFQFVDSLIAFTAFDENGIVGFFTLRNPGGVLDVYSAKKVSLGVFENNEPAYYCYKAVGFREVILEETETYEVLGEEWKCREMIIER